MPRKNNKNNNPEQKPRSNAPGNILDLNVIPRTNLLGDPIIPLRPIPDNVKQELLDIFKDEVLKLNKTYYETLMNMIRTESMKLEKLETMIINVTDVLKESISKINSNKGNNLDLDRLDELNVNASFKANIDLLTKSISSCLVKIDDRFKDLKRELKTIKLNYDRSSTKTQNEDNNSGLSYNLETNNNGKTSDLSKVINHNNAIHTKTNSKVSDHDYVPSLDLNSMNYVPDLDLGSSSLKVYSRDNVHLITSKIKNLMHNNSMSYLEVLNNINNPERSQERDLIKDLGMGLSTKEIIDKHTYIELRPRFMFIYNVIVKSLNLNL